jgi:hypothetical protein
MHGMRWRCRHYLLNVEDLAYTDDGVVDSGEGTNDEEQNVIMSDQDNDNDSDSASVGTNTYVGRHNKIILEEGKCLQMLVYLRSA